MSSPNDSQQPDPASQPGSSRRLHVSSGPTQPSSARTPETTARSRTRSTTGSLPADSRAWNAHHLPENPPFQAPPPLWGPSATPPPTPPPGNDSDDETTPTVGNPTTQRPETESDTIQVGQLQTRIQEMDQQIRMYNDVIMTRLTNLEQADDEHDSSSDEDNEALRAEIQALREEMTALRQTNPGGSSQSAAANTNSNSNLPQPGNARHGSTGTTPAHIPRISTVDQENGTPSQNARHNHSSSRRTTRSSRRDSRRISYRIKHDDSTDTDSDHSPSDEENQQAVAISFHQRQKGPKHPGLDSLVPSDERFDRLMSYRYYRLINTEPMRTHQSTTRLHKTLKNIELTMRDHKFSGEDPVLVLDFLTRVVEEADTLGMSEGQLIVCLPHLLTKKAAQHFRSASSHSRSGGLVCWPDAVQYLLRTYATEQAIRESVEHLENLLQATNEDENAFASRVGVAAYRCGNVHTEVEKIAIFVNGLLPAIRSIVSRFRREQPRHMLTFDRIVSYARDEGDSYRARMPTRTQAFGSSHRSASPDPHRAPSTNAIRSFRPGNRMVTFLEPPTDNLKENGGLLHLEPEHPTTPINGEERQDDEDADQLLAFQQRSDFQRNRSRSQSPRGRVQPPHIPG